MTGYPPEAFQADPQLRDRIIVEEDRPTAAAQMETVLTGHRPETLDLRIVHQDGSVRWVRSTLVPDLDAAGVLLAFDGIVIDITERKRAEQALQDANRRKDEFLAILAHELRNPLAPIRTGAYILGRQQDQDPKTREIISMIERQSAQMARLVDDLLDISRIERGKLELRKQRVNLGEVVNHAMEACKQILEEHRLTLSLPAAFPDVEADPIRLEQMLCNLVGNAGKFTPKGGAIEVFAALEGNEAVLGIRDNGEGMSSEVVSHSFDLFYQAGQALNQPHSGLGIGLTLVRQLAQLHGGSVQASSAGPGKGSEFIVRLPVLEPEPLPAAAPAPAQGQPGRRKHVLIIDDNDQVRAISGMLLEGLNCQVTTTASGEKGVELARALRPDIALVDLCMPGLDGLEVAARIRAALGQAVRLVALTGYSRECDIARTKAAGFDAHLVKSGDPRELLDLVRSLP